jgi:PPIC-type PPIASE domain
MIGHLISLLLILQAPKVIASNSEWSITAEQYDAIVKTFPEQDRVRFIDVGQRRKLLNELVRIWTLCAEARQHGIDVGTDYESQKNYYQQFAREVAATITGDVVRNYYDTHTDDFASLKVSQILILNGSSPVTPYPNVERLPYKEAENKAKEIKAMLDKGADWSELVRKYSQDLATKDNDGAVGFISTGQFEKSIDNALLSIKVGEISDVVGSVFGFHVFRLEDKKIRPFEELQEELRGKLINEEISRRLEAKVKAANVTIDESFF